jgi:dTDP-4-dehydrorhamnose 3,5-epimerase
MKLLDLPIAGAYVVEPTKHHDDRGFFARTFCAQAFRDAGLEPCVEQSSISSNDRRGTLRGMHLQAEPHAEAKLVRCTSGAAFDVLVDLRHDSPTFRRWWWTELTASAHIAVYVPPGVAHGFLTLEDGTELSYQISAPYVPGAATGVRWDDPAFGIEWPFPPALVSQRDQAFPDFSPRFL